MANVPCWKPESIRSIRNLSLIHIWMGIRDRLYGVSGVDTVDFNQDKNQLVICGMELERADLADRICDMGFEVLEG